MKALLAEFVGTYLLVAFGTGVIVVDAVAGGAIGHPQIALAWGAAVLVVIYALGPVSGAHINPAVSVGFALSGAFAWRRVPGYVAAQCLGALAASATLLRLFPDTATLGATVPSGSAGQAFALEVFLTAALMFVILHVARGPREEGMLAGLAVGTTVYIEALFGGPISGASMNPARSLGPALVAGELDHLWIYVAAPLLGAVSGVGVWWGMERLGAAD